METLLLTELNTGLSHKGIYAAAEYADRQELEAEAWRLIDSRETLPAVEVPRQEYEDNARTALMEALTASGHLSRVEFHGNLEEINARILSRLLNGWDESLPVHERQRRFAELCNELLVQRIHQKIIDGQEDPDLTILEISDYPSGLDTETAKSLGYGYRNQKGMVRSHYLFADADGTYTRVMEQGSRSRGLSQSTGRFYEAADIGLGSAEPEDIESLSTPCVYHLRDYADGTVDIMRRLDHHTGPGVIYGDGPADSANHVPYEYLREESARREAEIERYIVELASLEKQLDDWESTGQIRRPERLEIFKGQIDRILTAVCTLRPEYAEATFGKRAAPIFEEAGLLYASGQQQRAQELLESAQYMKEAVTFCGMSITVNEAQAKGLKVSSLIELLALGKENWKWKKGTCVVKDCPSRPQKVEIGPCSVCRKCQSIFDRGKLPKLIYKTGGFLTKLFAPKKAHRKEKVKTG